MTQPKALNAEGKCVCDERGEVCGIPREDTGLIHLPSGMCIRCGHLSACHPSPLNAEKEKSSD